MGFDLERSQYGKNVKYAAIKNDKAFIFLSHLQNGIAILEDSLAFSYKAKHNFTIQSSNCTPWFLPKRAEKSYVQIKKSRTQISLSALLVTAKSWMSCKQDVLQQVNG